MQPQAAIESAGCPACLPPSLNYQMPRRLARGPAGCWALCGVLCRVPWTGEQTVLLKVRRGELPSRV